MQGMKTQLIQLSTLLRLLDLAFWNYLGEDHSFRFFLQYSASLWLMFTSVWFFTEAQDSGYLYFCFRWLLIRFKRELHFQDVLRLWEVCCNTDLSTQMHKVQLDLSEFWWNISDIFSYQVMWTGLPCQNFHLLVCCAILDSEKQKIMDRKYGFNEILKVSSCLPLYSRFCFGINS